jgi:chromosome segregation ATPase
MLVILADSIHNTDFKGRAQMIMVLLCAVTRLDRMDFIPLDSCDAKPLPARLRQLGSSSTPAIDLLSYDPQYERAVVHVCG